MFLSGICYLSYMIIQIKHFNLYDDTKYKYTSWFIYIIIIGYHILSYSLSENYLICGKQKLAFIYTTSLLHSPSKGPSQLNQDSLLNRTKPRCTNAITYLHFKA